MPQEIYKVGFFNYLHDLRDADDDPALFEWLVPVARAQGLTLENRAVLELNDYKEGYDGLLLHMADNGSPTLGFSYFAHVISRLKTPFTFVAGTNSKVASIRDVYGPSHVYGRFCDPLLFASLRERIVASKAGLWVPPSSILQPE